MRQLAPYSDSIDKAPATLRKLIESDARIVGFSIENDCGTLVVIYTDSRHHDDGNGSGTFTGNGVRAAIRWYKENVREVAEADPQIKGLIEEVEQASHAQLHSIARRLQKSWESASRYSDWEERRQRIDNMQDIVYRAIASHPAHVGGV